MRTIVLSICFGLVLVGSAVAQVARDTPPPAIETARRERELRAIVDSGKATKDTYLELATLLNRQHRSAEVIDALRGAAALDPNSAEAQHRLATFCWEIASKGTDLDAAARMRYILDGIAAEDRALAINPDYLEAMTYKNILLRMQANVVDDPAEKARLVADADALRNHVIAAQKERQAAANAVAPSLQSDAPEPPPPFSGFNEAFADTAARLTPVRVGGNIPPPTKTHDAKPVYPAEAQSARVQGVVIIEATIGPNGKVQDARVLRSIPLLDSAALDAVRQWEFTPTLLNGVPVPVIMTVTVQFTLS